MEITGKRLIELRKEMNITQAEAAHRIGISPKTYIRWEKGLGKRGFDTIIKIARFYSVTIDFLLGLK